jgi:putative acetyltransferase
MHVRPAQPEDRDQLLEIWERSVRATHHFLKVSEIAALRQFVAEELAKAAVDWWLLESARGFPIGFLGVTHGAIEALFMDPDHQRQGGGRLLVAHAQGLGAGTLAVDVNEQNEGAVRFYESLGFSVIGRSPTDAGGRPFPILHMERTVPEGR